MNHLAIAIIMWMYLPFAPLLPTCCLANDGEYELIKLIINHPQQGRLRVRCSPILSESARAKSKDMADRMYFGHISPDGIGPNRMVTDAGYKLPSYYGAGDTDNNIESLGGGYHNAQAAFDGWLNSPGHHMHAAGEGFYADQRSIGVGYVYDPDSFFKHYWTFLSAHDAGNNCNLDLYEWSRL